MDVEAAKKAKEERGPEEAEAAARRAEDERKRREAEEAARRAEQERRHKEAAEAARKADEKRRRREAEAIAKTEEVEVAQREVEEVEKPDEVEAIDRRAEDERRRKEAEEAAREAEKERRHEEAEKAREKVEKGPAEEKPVPKPEPGGWDGVERSVGAGANVVDINTATLQELCKIPTVGVGRAKLIIEDREKNGRFKSIYDLTRINGIGAKQFRRMTGLPLGRKRRDRHDALNEVLGIGKELRPTLSEVMSLAIEKLPARGCILVRKDGIALVVKGVDSADAKRYSALMPQLFRRSRIYLKRLSGENVNAIVLPGVKQPLALLMADEVFLLVVMRKDCEMGAVIDRARNLMGELGWLLSTRAAVREP